MHFFENYVLIVAGVAVTMGVLQVTILSVGLVLVCLLSCTISLCLFTSSGDFFPPPSPPPHPPVIHMSNIYVTLHHKMSRNLPDDHFHVFIFSEGKFYAFTMVKTMFKSEDYLLSHWENLL